MRRFPTLGVLLAVLCMVLSVASASAADVFPGKVFYAKGANWRAEINVAAPLDTALEWDVEGCIVVGPSPCQNIKIDKGGARTLSSSFIADYFAGPDIGVVNVPAGAWSASSFLEFNDGHTHTAFTVPALRWALDNPLDDFRAATAARTADKTTCSTFYTEAEHGTAIQVVAYGADGERARDEDGHYSPTDVYFIGPRSVAQGCLGDWLNADGSVRVKGPSFTAGSVRLSFGCAGVGPCPAPQRTWFVVTAGPLSGATVETLPTQNIGAVEGTSAATLAAATASGGERDALIRLHGPAPDALRDAVETHNAAIRRMRDSSAD